MSYMNDPREMQICPPSATTWEEDNRVEARYQWGARIIDLCDLPVEEYMKPLTVISTTGYSYTPIPPVSKINKEEINICATIINAAGEEVSVLMGAPTDGESIEESASTREEWKVLWRWNGSFNGQSVKTAVRVYVGTQVITVSAILTDNEDKKHEESFFVEGEERPTQFESYGVGAATSADEEIVETVYEEMDEASSTQYTYTISDEISFIYLSLKFILDGVVNTEYSKNNMLYGDTIVFPTIDEEGYEFDGWSISGGSAFTSTVMPDKNLVLVGTRKVKKFTVTFVLSGVTTVKKNVPYNTVLKASDFPATAKAGYTFMGWEPSSATPISANTTFIGEYDAKKYTIIFVLGNGEDDIVKEVSYKQIPSCDAPADYSTAQYDYTFSAWTPTIVAATKNATYTAVYSKTVKKYTLSVNGVESQVAYGTSINVLNEIKKSLIADDKNAIAAEVSDATKYNVVVEGDASSISDVITMDENGKSITYTVTPVSYSLGYYDYDGSIISESTVAYKEAIGTAPEATRTGYTFSKWSPEEVNEMTVMPNHSVSATAVYDINRYVITFNDYDGFEISAITVDYNTIPTAPVPTRNSDGIWDYEFNGWDKEVVAATENTTYVAQYTATAIEYQINFIVNGEVAETYMLSASTIPAYTGSTPTKESTPQFSYAFSGWQPTIAEVSGPQDYNAVFSAEVRSYQISFSGYEGVVKSEVLEYGNVPTAPENVTDYLTIDKVYTFNGEWEPAIKAVEGEQVYIAQYDEEAREYQVDINTTPFSFAYGTELSYTDVLDELNEDYKDGSKYTVTATVNGETFASSDVAFISGNTAFSVDAIPVKYQIIYKIDDIIIETFDVDYGEEIEIEETPTPLSKDGYKFEGWSPDVNGMVMPNHDIEVNGTYNPITIDVYFGGVMKMLAISNVVAGIKYDINEPNLPDGYEYTYEATHGTVTISKGTLTYRIYPTEIGEVNAKNPAIINITSTPITHTVSVNVSGETDTFEKKTLETIDLSSYEKEGYILEWDVNTKNGVYTVPAVNDVNLAVNGTYTKKAVLVRVIIREKNDDGLYTQISENVYNNVEWGVNFNLVAPSYDADTKQFSWNVTTPFVPEYSNDVIEVIGTIEPKMTSIYYGMTKSQTLGGLTSLSEMESYETIEEITTPSEMIFPMSVDADYADNYALYYDEEEMTDEEWGEYLNTIAVRPTIVVPKGMDMSTYIYKLSGYNALTMTKGQTITIDGSEYDVWYYDYSWVSSGQNVNGFYAIPNGADSVKITISK